jgi:hypothetical protein
MESDIFRLTQKGYAMSDEIAADILNVLLN